MNDVDLFSYPEQKFKGWGVEEASMFYLLLLLPTFYSLYKQADWRQVLCVFVCIYIYI